MSLDPKAIVSLADIKAYLSNPPAEQDPVLEALVNQTTILVESFLGRTLISTIYTSLKLDGPKSEFLYLPNWPVTDLASVYEDDDLLVEGSTADFLSYLSEGVLRRTTGRWLQGAQTITVTYTAGYELASIPRDIQFLVLNRIAREWQKQKGSMWGQTSQSMGDGSISFDFPLALTKDERTILSVHRRMRL